MRRLLLIANSAAGDLLNVQRLLREGLDPNASDSGAWTSLHLAAARGHVDVLRLLLSRGADPTARNGLGDTPLHVAIMLNQAEAAKVLLERAGSSLLRLADNGGRTPGNCASGDAPPADSTRRLRAGRVGGSRETGPIGSLLDPTPS